MATTTDGSIEEQVSKGNIKKIMIIASDSAGVDFDKLKVDVFVQLYGERHAYQTSYTVSRELLDPDKEVWDRFLGEMSKVFKEVVAGKRELNAVV